MASSATRHGFGRADRVLLRSAAWALASFAALVLVSTIAGVVAWWRLAGNNSIDGGSRAWPVVAFALTGAVVTLMLYGLSRACRAVARLADHAAATTPAPRPNPTSVSGRATRTDVPLRSSA